MNPGELYKLEARLSELEGIDQACDYANEHVKLLQKDFDDLMAKYITARAETADLTERYRICHESAVGLREAAAKLRAEAAAMLEKVAALIQTPFHGRSELLPLKIQADRILELITTDQAAALAERDKEQREIGQQSAKAILQSYLTNGMATGFVHELTLPMLAEQERKVRLEEAEWWNEPILPPQPARHSDHRERGYAWCAECRENRFAELRAAAERGKVRK